MSPSESLREFIRERLIAAAEEIFSEFDKTIVQFEEELDRQRRLLETSWRPRVELQRTEVRQKTIWDEGVLHLDRYFCKKERCLNPEAPGSPQISDQQDKPGPLQLTGTKDELGPGREEETLQIVEYQEEPECPLIKCKQKQQPQQLRKNHKEPECSQMKGEKNEPESTRIKDTHEELFISLEKELEVKQEMDTYGERDHREPDPGSNSFQESQSPERGHPADSRSSGDEDLKREKMCQRTGGRRVGLDIFDVKKQENKHTNRNLCSCDVCGKILARTYLSEHMKIHTDERLFLCTVCGKSFRQQNHLTAHMRIHTGEKPFPCAICGKSFTLQMVLTKHIQTHTGEKPFSCLTCGKSFRHSGTLSQHTRIHTGEKPFPCLTCGKPFSDKRNLSRHIRTHTDERPFSCPTCGKNFRQGGHLTVHMRTHTVSPKVLT